MSDNDAGRLTAETLVQRLEEAGQTLLALPESGHSTRLARTGLMWVRDAAEAYSPGRTRLRPAVPDAAHISRMDEALGWIPLIPLDKYVLRRVVGARCLVNPMTGRHLYTWRRLAVAIGADHKAVQRWHSQGIAAILEQLRPGWKRPCATPGGVAQTSEMLGRVHRS